MATVVATVVSGRRQLATGNGKATSKATSKATAKEATVATVVQGHVQTQGGDGGDSGGRWCPANRKWRPAMAKPT